MLKSKDCTIVLNNLQGSASDQCCSPRDHGLGLEAPRGHKLKSWSWSCTHGLGLA